LLLFQYLKSSNLLFNINLQVNEYNKHVSKFPLPTYDRTDNVGIILAHNKNFWPFFVEWIKTLPSIPKDPLDTHFRLQLERISTLCLSSIKHEIRYDWNTPQEGKFIHVQSAGHFAGVAHYDREVMWSIHPLYGAWFVYRAVVILDVPFESSLLTPV
jgi:hypothetical protein